MKSTDRELLELAAKAAGYEVRWVDQYDCGLTDTYLIPLKPKAQHFSFAKYPYERWNPLTDDGDALRLAVDLNIDIYAQDGDGRVGALDSECNEIWEPAGTDPFAATRRAIVRAAAETARNSGS